MTKQEKIREKELVKLMPCPFCGNTVKDDNELEDCGRYSHYGIVCNECDLTFGYWRWEADRPNFRKRWNERKSKGVVGMKRIDFTVRQRAKLAGKFCYYRGFDGEKHRWTKKLKEADLFLDAPTAFAFKDKLKFNYPQVIAVVRNESDKIVRIFRPSRKKYC